MSKYIIVDKDKKGNKGGERYTITYQLQETGNIRHKVDMFCICDDPVKYCYIADQYGYGLNTTEDRAEFLDEFYEFQKGGSYRKTHPITYSNIELIQQEIKEHDDKIYELKRKLDEEKVKAKHLKFEHYYEDVDTETLNIYVESIKNAIMSNDRFYVSGIEFNIWEGHRVFIYDRDLQKPVKIITIRDGNVDTRDLTEDDMHID